MTETDDSLLSATDIRRIATEIGLRPTKTLGQNYVIDPNTIRRIVASARLGDQEHVLEVGPGLGSLTLGLLDAADAVTAIEIDPLPAERLPRTVAEFRENSAERFSLITDDAMQVTEAQLAAARPSSATTGPTSLVANLPYNVAVPVLLHLLAEVPTLRSGLVMVQDEVADRLSAGPGSKIYGVPSVKLAWYAHAEKAGVVGMNVFWPAPKIRSGLVRFTHRKPPVTTASRDEVFAVIDAAFAQRRKTVRAALSTWAGSPPAAEQALVAAGVDPRARGEVLTIEDFAAIAEHRPAPAESADQASS